MDWIGENLQWDWPVTVAAADPVSGLEAEAKGLLYVTPVDSVMDPGNVSVTGRRGSYHSIHWQQARSCCKEQQSSPEVLCLYCT